MHDGPVDPACELRAQAAGGDDLEAVDQAGECDLGRVVHERVDVVRLAVEYLQLRVEDLAHLAHDLFAARQHLVVHDAAPVLGDEDQMRMQVLPTTVLPLRISGFGSRRGDMGQR